MPAFAMATVAAVMAPPATSVRGVGAWAVGIGLGGLYGLALARRLHPTPSLDDLPVPTAVAAVGLGAGVAAAAALAVVLGDPRAVWIPLTVLVVGGTVARGQGRRTRDRALGTIAGVAIALVVVALQPPAWLPVILGVAALVGALAAAASSYRLQVLFITLAVVLTAGSPDTIAAAATSRLAYTLAGGAILMVGLVVARRFVPRLPRPDDEDTDPAVRRT